MDNKGFTLIELLAIIVILSLIFSVGTYAVMNYIDTAKKNADKLLINNIKTASELYIDECTSGISTLECSFSRNDPDVMIINTTLQTLADSNLLSATDNKIFNSKNEDIGSCKIIIKKEIDNNYNVTYTITSNSESTEEKCPDL